MNEIIYITQYLFKRKPNFKKIFTLDSSAFSGIYSGFRVCLVTKPIKGFLQLFYHSQAKMMAENAAKIVGSWPDLDG